MHNWWRIWALGFHQETTEESRTQQNWFCIKLYIILYQTSFILVYTVLENVINITNFSTKSEIQNITFNASTNIIFNPRKLLQISVTKFKTIDIILMCLEILLHKHKADIKVPGIVKQTVNRK